MLAVTLVFALLFVTGFIGRKPSDRVGASGRTATSTVTVASVERGLYRGHTARYYARLLNKAGAKIRAERTASRHALAATVKNGYGKSWLERAFLCIHRYEGSWTDSGAPFWGGLQMDSSFQSTYGDWAVAAFGTADKWPVSVQIATAIRAKVSGRGFYPWPNTARKCGLI